MEGLDVTPSSGQQHFEAEMADGLPAYNDRLTSPLLWPVVAPCSDPLQADPWHLSLESGRQELISPASPVDHSLKLGFFLCFEGKGHGGEPQCGSPGILLDDTTNP